jgi:hypothetical protein
MNELEIREERPAAAYVSNGQEPELAEEELDLTEGSYESNRQSTSQVTAATDLETTLLFTPSDLKVFQSQWSELQIGFVDDPRRAVAEADKLVAAVTQRIADGFAAERARLEKQWYRGQECDYGRDAYRDAALPLILWPAAQGLM